MRIYRVPRAKSDNLVYALPVNFRNLIDIVMLIKSLFTLTMIRIPYVKVQLSSHDILFYTENLHGESNFGCLTVI
jgi:hypothetical protein